MKMKKVLASAAVLAIAVVTVFSSGSMVRAEERKGPDIELAIKNEAGRKVIAKEDAKVINKAFGYDNGNDEVIIAKNNTSASVDWAKSKFPYESVMSTKILCPQFSRDNNGNLIIKTDGNNQIEYSYKSSIGWWGSKETEYAGGELNFFDIRDTKYYREDSINNHLGMKIFKDYGTKDFVDYKLSDVYIIRIEYTTDGKGNYYDSNTENRTFGLTDYWVLPEGVSTVLNLENKPTNSHTHSWKFSKIIKATTKKNGSITETCSGCKKTRTTTIYFPKKINLSKTSYTYNGKTQKPSVTIKDSKGKAINKNSYAVSYKNNRNVGEAAVTIKFKGNYSGTLTKTFQIVPKPTAITKVSAKKKGFTVNWKRQASQTTGYQIQYSPNKNFKSARTVSVNNKTVTRSISELSPAKKYYVRVRTYKQMKIKGKTTKLYSQWSYAKQVVTKK